MDFWHEWNVKVSGLVIPGRSSNLDEVSNWSCGKGERGHLWQLVSASLGTSCTVLQSWSLIVWEAIEMYHITICQKWECIYQFTCYLCRPSPVLSTPTFPPIARRRMIPSSLGPSTSEHVNVTQITIPHQRRLHWSDQHLISSISQVIRLGH